MASIACKRLSCVPTMRGQTLMRREAEALSGPGALRTGPSRAGMHNGWFDLHGEMLRPSAFARQAGHPGQAPASLSDARGFQP